MRPACAWFSGSSWKPRCRGRSARWICRLLPRIRDKSMLKIAFLADHIKVIPILAQWFQKQWPDYYAGRSLADIEQDFQENLHRDCLPLRLVAFESEAPVG